MGLWIAMGVGVGAAIGSATHSIAIWIAIGAGVGAQPQLRSNKRIPVTPDSFFAFA